VRLVSEELGALIESRFPKEAEALDLKFMRLYSSRQVSEGRHSELPLAIHTARICTRLCRDDDFLSRYLSCESSTRISDMMLILLRSAGNILTAS
jgi:hypothetical protein